jgi:hypothetical protein
MHNDEWLSLVYYRRFGPHAAKDLLMIFIRLVKSHTSVEVVVAA